MFHPEFLLRDERWMLSSAMAEDIQLLMCGRPHIVNTNGEEIYNSCLGNSPSTDFVVQA